MPRALGLRVSLAEAEQTRKSLLDQGVLRTDLRIRREGNSIILPLKGPVPGIGGLVEMEFEANRASPSKYQDLVQIPPELRRFLPTSFDSIGEILVLHLPETLRPYRREIGRALLQANGHARTVCLDRGVRGEERVRDVEVVAGEENTLTTYQEYGLRIAVDVARAYVSPRLANEHRRVAGKVQRGEVVADLFCGVGGFALMIAKMGQAAKIYAIDSNPSALELLEKSLRLNRLSGVEIVTGDARERWKDLPPLHRVILDFPQGDFFSLGLEALRTGGALHYYRVLREEDRERFVESLLEEAEWRGYAITLDQVQTVRAYAPGKNIYGMDFTVRKR